MLTRELPQLNELKLHNAVDTDPVEAGSLDNATPSLARDRHIDGRRAP